MSGPEPDRRAGAVLRTARLILAPVTRADAAGLHALWTDAEVRRFLWDGVEIPRAETDAAIGTSAGLFAERGFGLWRARSRTDGTGPIVGFAGLWFFRDPPELELVYGVAANRWSEGFATEMARAVARHAIDTLGHATVRASTDFANAASVRVLEKAGFEFDRRETRDDLDTVYYRIDRAGSVPGAGAA